MGVDQETPTAENVLFEFVMDDAPTVCVLIREARGRVEELEDSMVWRELMNRLQKTVTAVQRKLKDA